MKIRQVLKEAAGVTAAFAFGRFNPAHQGHIAVWQTVEKAGVKWYIGTNPGTLGPNDPLTFEQKTAWMEEIYPPIQGHIVPEQSVMTLAARIFKELGNKEDATIAYITDETDWAWSGKLLNQYNGVEGKHGYYKFAQIVHVPSPRVSSATALRDAARADDKVAFYHASGTDPKLKVNGQTYFDTVKEACAKYPLPVKKAKKTEGVAEGLPQTLRKVVPGYAKREIDKKMDAGKFGKTDADKDANFHRYKKIQDKLKEGDKKPHPQTWHDVDAKLGKQVDKMSQAEKVKKGLAHPNTLKKPGVAEAHPNSKIYDKCWDGYKKVPGKKRGEKGSCVEESFTPMQIAMMEGGHSLEEMDSQGHTGTRDTKSKSTYGNRDNYEQGPEGKAEIVKPDDVVKQGAEILRKSFKDNELDEATLATMRDYFAGDENARDPSKLSKIRDFYSKQQADGKIDTKQFNSVASYIQWLEKHGHKQVSKVKEADDKIAGRYDPEEFDAMVGRLKKLAKAGPMKTVWDPEKRVYKNVPDTDKQKKIAEAVVKVVEVIKQRKGLWKNK